MVAWIINRIPTDSGQVSSGHYAFMLQILFSMQNLSHTNTCLELSFLHTTGEEISTNIILRDTAHNGIIPILETQLSVANYQIERLSAEASAALSQQMLSMASVDMNAVIKS